MTKQLIFRVLATGLLSIAGIGATLAVVSLRLTSWRRTWVGRLQAVQEEWRGKAAAYQSQLADSRKSEASLIESLEDARAQHAKLSEQHAALLGDLDARMKAER